ncbi:hypothetical protein CAI21_00215 [Alkalilimnicola ehrlichii]|uniref:Uncharacterized protein n=1 Tax=Alkalilimnicola ehrlichii TaxID=351052 RepID=A0A3E0X1P9_9GAMM|nr:hypothetical protein [Alkalilimnicola ehrlichii]RFA31124.1 hypothetical protein CAI21_00215 [Alkalilimnicola ehrlichii]RFA39589.1 hypothetical protein CAL65_02190 [Alkalilimnicola ehrlichii]
MDIEVETGIGPWGDPEPAVFFVGSRRVAVLSIVDRWLADEHAYFKVAADDGGTYILRFDYPSGRWEMTLFSSGEQH